MSLLPAHPLDNPAWYALTETHARFGGIYKDIHYYKPEYAPFAAYDKDTDGLAHRDDNYLPLPDECYVLGKRPVTGPGWQVTKEVPCLQMLIEQPIDIEVHESIVELDSSHGAAVFDLVNLVQPGYIKPKTILLGNYAGIIKEDVLVAVTGERMQMNDYTEVSAVCTLPGHSGKGYASQLMTHAVKRIFAENKTPFLHVAESNTGAIRLYEKLGFITRVKISAWQVAKQENKQR